MSKKLQIARMELWRKRLNRWIEKDIDQIKISYADLDSYDQITLNTLYGFDINGILRDALFDAEFEILRLKKTMTAKEEL